MCLQDGTSRNLGDESRHQEPFRIVNALGHAHFCERAIHQRPRGAQCPMQHRAGRSPDPHLSGFQNFERQ